MWKLTRDLKTEPLDEPDPLYTCTLTLISVVPPYQWKFSNTQQHSVVKCVLTDVISKRWYFWKAHSNREQISVRPFCLSFFNTIPLQSLKCTNQLLNRCIRGLVLLTNCLKLKDVLRNIFSAWGNNRPEDTLSDDLIHGEITIRWLT